MAEQELTSYQRRADFAARRAILALEEVLKAPTPCEEHRALERARNAFQAGFEAIDGYIKLDDALPVGTKKVRR